jgi:hypothetical protein
MTWEEIQRQLPIEGHCYDIAGFAEYLRGLHWLKPRTAIYLHHTWKPTVADWRGLATIRAMQRTYATAPGYGWDKGPHLFIGPDGIWTFYDLRKDGYHAGGWYNVGSIGVEMVGNYDAARPSGPVLEYTVAALALLCQTLKLSPRDLRFHRDVSSKTCPGRAVTKEWIIPQVEAYLAGLETGGQVAREVLAGAFATQLVQPNPATALSRSAERAGYLGAITDEVAVEINGRRYVAQLWGEVLLVPQGQWDQVKPLSEWEKEGI